MSNNLFWEDLYQNDEEKYQKEFILSYYFALLKASGPLNVETLEASWSEQIELFSDVSFYVTNGISNFLLMSRKFKFINGKVQAIDNNFKDADLSKHKIIKTEYPTVDQIITYNIEQHKLLMKSLNNEDDKNKIKPVQSLELKINAIIIFSNVQKQDDIQVFIRPAIEYSTHNMLESLRANGSYSFKYSRHFSDSELDLISCLLRKHFLLLDYRNDDTFGHFIFSEKCKSEMDNNSLNDFDEYLINNVNNEIFYQPSNISYLQTDNLLSEIMHKYVIAVQKFLFECEITRKKLGDKNMEIQSNVFKMALNNKLQYQCMNYLIFIHNLTAKQIKRFQDKALKILTAFHEIKPAILSNSSTNFENRTACISTWKLRLYEIKEEFKKVQAVFKKFEVLMCEKNLDLKALSFVRRKEEPPDNLHSMCREILKDNVMCKKQLGNTNIHLQVLQEYIYGPYIGILNKPKHMDNTSKNNFKDVFSSGFAPKLYFVKSSHNLNVSDKKSNKTDKKSNKTNKIKTNIRDAENYSDINNYLLNSLQAPNESIAVTGNVDHEIKLRMSISNFNKYVFSVNNFNRFEIIVNSNSRKKLSTLNMTELCEELAKYITEYSSDGRIFMSKEQLRYFDFLTLPISIYFGSQTKTGIFEPFITIKCNLSRDDNLPRDIEVEIKKLKSEKRIKTNSFSSNGSCDESLCSQFANVLKINTSEFLNEPSEPKLLSIDSPKSILISSTGTKPKQSNNLKKKQSKNVKLNENLETCCICREIFRKHSKIFLKCQHSFHKQCIEIWHQNHRLCPVCRAIIQYEEFPPLSAI